MRKTLYTSQEIIDATDQCVLCGLCLPHCPTYNIAKVEAESPRGRISLVRALHEKTLIPKQDLIYHLDNCLACMSCQSVCPANVEYEKILESGREITNAFRSKPHKIKRSIILFILTNLIARKTIQLVLNVYRFLKVETILHFLSFKFPYKLRLINLIPSQEKLKFPRTIPNKINNKPRVLLINSCANDLFADKTIAATKHVLHNLNCEAIVQNKTYCCGALHQHDGDRESAYTLMQKFSTYFKKIDFDVSIPIATGCGAHIKRLPQLLNDKSSYDITNKLFELNSYIINHPNFNNLKFKPLEKEICLHIPCTHYLVTEEIEATEKLLKKIPLLKVKMFQDNLLCCGAGGMNSVTQPKLADKLIKEKVKKITLSNASIFVTSNFGCGLHFQSLLKRKGYSIKVCHPITLIAQQLVYS